MTDDARSIELSVEVPGTVEEVWDAIATGPGITSWFIPMTVEERTGGRVAMDFGEMGTEHATVAAWEPPHRVVFEGEGERALAYEWLVESRGGGSCVVRLVNSGFGHGDDWDGQFDGMTNGWTIFLENLKLQLTHFRGQRASAAVPFAMVAGPNDAAWKRLCDVLGIDASAVRGDVVSTGGGAPELTASVHAAGDGPGMRYLNLLIDGPVPGHAFVAAEGDGDQIAASMYLYFYGSDAAATVEAWRTWFPSRFAPAD